MDDDATKRKSVYLAALARSADADEPEDGIFRLLPLDAFRLTALRETEQCGPPELLARALEHIANRRDCADFVLVGLLRLLLRNRLDAAERAAVVEAARTFCYWWDQRAIAGMCFHTENHQILFHAAELLAGEALPETVFAASGRTGAWHAAQASVRIQRWLDHRRRFGFAEWLSCYFDEDLLALVSLVDFADDPQIRAAARAAVDFLLGELATHCHRGVIGVSQGRTYAEFLKGRRRDPLGTIAWLAFGVGAPDTTHPSFAAVALATSDYACPVRIVPPPPEGRVVTARYGVSPQEARAAGIHLNDLDQSLLFWAVQNARLPELRHTAARLADAAADPWLQRFVAEAQGRPVETALGPVDVYAFQTPHVQLSCAQDFRPGQPGYQQHIWQATVDADAVVFTTQPGGRSESSAHGDRPNFWAGNRWLPRAAQWHDTLVCLHRAPADAPLPFAHAYFPRAAFDDVRDCGDWTFGRKGQGFVALYSPAPTLWASDHERRAEGPESAWVCRVGDGESFDAFCAATAATPIAVDGLRVRYGALAFGWDGPMTVDGAEVPLHDYPRPTFPEG